MTNKFSVTIAIPAFNEQANINYLLRRLLDQKRRNFELDKVLVVSDGSTDNTIQIVKNIRNKKISVIDGKTNKGVAFRQNQITKLVNSDILVFLDADVLPLGRNFIEKLVEPIINSQADLTSGELKELNPQTTIGKAIAASMEFKRWVFAKCKQGNNLYTCHGTSRAFSKRLYKSIKFTHSVGQDAYSYLFCVKNNFQYKFVPRAVLFYKAPENFADHKLQSERFFKSEKIFLSEFKSDFVNKEYNLPISLMIVGFLLFLVKRPILLSLYTLMFLSIKLYSKWNRKVESTQNWKAVKSSKVLN